MWKLTRAILQTPAGSSTSRPPLIFKLHSFLPFSPIPAQTFTQPLAGPKNRLPQNGPTGSGTASSPTGPPPVPHRPRPGRPQPRAGGPAAPLPHKRPRRRPGAWTGNQSRGSAGCGPRPGPQREAGQGPAPRQPALHPARTTATAPRGSGPGHATDTPPRRYLSCRSYLCSFRLARPGCAIAARSPAAGAAQARASTCAGAPDGCGEGGAAGGAGPSPQGWEPPAELRRRGLSPCLARVIPAGELRRLLGVCRGSAPRRASCGCLLLPAGPGPADPGSWARGFRAGIGGYLRLGCEAAGFVPWLLLWVAGAASVLRR